MLVLFVSACGGGENPTQPVVPVDTTHVVPTVTVVSVAISGHTAVLVGTPSTFRAIARFSDGSEKDVTMEASWRALDSGVKLAFGSFLAYAPGDVVVEVQYKGTVGAIQLVVSYPAPVGWSSLPPLSEEGKAWIKAYNLNSLGFVYRWRDTVRVWAQPGFSRAVVDSAVSFWQNEVGEHLVFVVVPDSTGKKQVSITFSNFVGDPDNPCGRGGPEEVDELFAIIQGTVKIRPGCNNTLIVAHEIGHALGLLGHTSTGDIMGVNATRLVSSPFLRDVVGWILSVPVGTRIAN